ncbi:MAG: RNA polymerase sigma factor [Vicinamibacterales bacterium]
MDDRARRSTGVTDAELPANTTEASSGSIDASAARDMMVAYQSGVLEGFKDLYALLAPPLRRYLGYLARHHDVADDLLQETFLQMHRSRASWDPTRPVAPWAFGLARNVFLMHRRAASRFSAVHQASDSPPEIPVPAEADSLAARDLVQRALAALGIDQSESLLLHHVWGFTFEEIAGMTGVTPAAARARSSRAMAALRATLSAGQERP